MVRRDINESKANRRNCIAYCNSIINIDRNDLLQHVVISRDFQEDIVEENILKLYKEHPDELNEFAELCLVEEKIRISRVNIENRNYKYKTNYDGWYIFSNNVLTDEFLLKLDGYLDIFKDYGYDSGFSLKYDDERKGKCFLGFKQGVWIFSRSVDLVYQEKEIEEDDLIAR